MSGPAAESRVWLRWLGFLAAIAVVVLLGYRTGYELEHRQYIVAVPISEVEYLSEKSGLLLPEALDILVNSGVNGAVITEKRMWQLLRRGAVTVRPSEESQGRYHIRPQSDKGSEYLRRGLQLRELSHCTSEVCYAVDEKRDLKFEILDARPGAIPDWPLSFDEKKISLAVDKDLKLIAGIDGLSILRPEVVDEYFHDLSVWADAWYIKGQEPVDGDIQHLEKVLHSMNGVPPVLIEFSGQRAFEKVVRQGDQIPLWLHSISRREMSRYAPDRQEALRRYRRAVQERGVSIALYRPDQSGSINDFADFIQQSVKRNRKLPWPVFSDQSAISSRAQVDYGLSWLHSFLIIAIGVIFCAFMYGCMSGEGNWPGGLRVLIVMLAMLYVPATVMLIYNGSSLPAAMAMLAVACLGPSYSTSGIYRKTGQEKRSMMLCLVWAATVSALLSTPYYINRIGRFQGVKVALLFPPAIALLSVLRDQKMKLLDFFWSLKALSRGMIVFCATSLVVVAGGLYIVRSGNYFAEFIPGWETAARAWLEDWMLVRPRTKEWLIAWPALFWWLSSGRRDVSCSIAGAIRGLVLVPAVAVGIASVVNTFCHAHSPLILGLWRTGNGFAAGLAMYWLTVLLYYRFLVPLFRSVALAAEHRENKDGYD